MWRHKGRDLPVQVQLPVHALRDGLDHQVATAQLLHVFLVVGLAYQGGVLRHSQRGGLELLQALDGTQDDAVFRPLLGW